MTTYKALVQESPDQVLPTVKTFPVPSVQQGTALIQPLYADIASYSRVTQSGSYVYPMVYPFTPGGSCVARIEAVGNDAVSLKPGDLVWVDALLSARDDPDVQGLLGFYGNPGKAQTLMKAAGSSGSMAEKAMVPIENCYLLSEKLFKSKEEGGCGYSIRDMTGLTYVVVAFGGLDLLNVGPGTTVIVAPATGKFSGGGVLAALALGAKVIAASRNKEKLDMLHELSMPGAVERLTTVPLTGDVDKDAEAMMAATGGAGAHVYVDLSPPAASGPTTPPHFTAAMKVLRRNATVLLEGGIMSDVSFNYFDVMLKNITIRGNFMYEKPQVERMLRMIENGNLFVGERVGMTIKATFELEEVEKALAAAGKSASWGGDVLLAPNAE